MAQSTFMRFAPVFLGVAAASTFLAPLSAQAANMSFGEGFIKFSKVQLAYSGGASLFNNATFPASKGNTSSAFLTDGLSVSGPNPDNGGPDVTPGPGQPAPTQGFVRLEVPATGSFSEAFGEISIPAGVVPGASSEATTDFALVRSGVAESTSNSANNQTNIQFNVSAAQLGQTINFSGIIETFLKATVVGSGVSQVQYNASFTITGPGGVFFFTAPPINGAVAVIGAAGVDVLPYSMQNISLMTGPLTQTGTYRLAFNSNITSQGSHAAMSVPEPSAVLGLAGVALVGVLARKRRLG